MYLQIELSEADRRSHRFLWRNLESDRDPGVYEFRRCMFGVNAFPFLAHLVFCKHAYAILRLRHRKQATRCLTRLTWMTLRHY